MSMDPDASSAGNATGNLYNEGVDLIRQFEKVLLRMKRRQMNRHEATDGPVEQQPQLPFEGGPDGCACCQSRRCNSNASNLGGSIGRHTVVRIEPSELKLAIRLDTWVSDSGSLVIRPTLLAADQNQSSSASSGDTGGCTCASASEGKAADATVGSWKACMRGTIQGQQQQQQQQVQMDAPTSDDKQQPEVEPISSRRGKKAATFSSYEQQQQSRRWPQQVKHHQDPDRCTEDGTDSEDKVEVDNKGDKDSRSNTCYNSQPISPDREELGSVVGLDCGAVVAAGSSSSGASESSSGLSDEMRQQQQQKQRRPHRYGRVKSPPNLVPRRGSGSKRK